MTLSSYTGPVPHVGSPDACFITRSDEAVQRKSQRSVGVTIVEPRRRTRAHAAKSPAAKTQHARPFRGKHTLVTSQRQRHTAAKLTTFMIGILRFVKAYAILRQKLHVRSSEHTFDQGKRVLVSRVTTHLDIRDCVSMKTGRLSQVPNRPIQRSTRHPDLCTCHRQETVPLSHVTKSQLMITISPNKGGANEHRIV
jgi:hypothetical protein